MLLTVLLGLVIWTAVSIPIALLCARILKLEVTATPEIAEIDSGEPIHRLLETAHLKRRASFAPASETR